MLISGNKTTLKIDENGKKRPTLMLTILSCFGYQAVTATVSFSVKPPVASTVSCGLLPTPPTPLLRLPTLTVTTLSPFLPSTTFTAADVALIAKLPSSAVTLLLLFQPLLCPLLPSSYCRCYLIHDGRPAAANQTGRGLVYGDGPHKPSGLAMTPRSAIPQACL